MTRMHATRKMVLAVGLGMLLTFGSAATGLAQVPLPVPDAVVCDGCVDSKDILDLGVTNTDLAGSAVTSDKIADGTIANTDISVTAAIAGTKIAPNFGSKNVVTTGKVGIGTTTPGSFNLYVAAPTQRTAFGSTANGTRSLLQFYAKDGGGILRGRMLGYDPNKQNIVLDAGGDGTASNVVINQGGNVGIGTTTPNMPLVIKGDGSANAVGFNDAADVPRGSIFVSSASLGLNASTKLYLTSNGSGITIDAGGNVGIGTTTPQDKLDVEGGSIVVNRYAGNFSSGLYLTSTIGPTHYNWRITAQDQVSDALEFGSSTGPGVTTWAAPAMVIKQSGNVGIGTTSPSVTGTGLHIYKAGDAMIKVDTAGVDGGNAYFTGVSGSPNGAMYVTNATARNLYLGTGSQTATQLTINPSGNVGIGTTDPRSPFAINNGTGTYGGLWVGQGTGKGWIYYGNSATDWKAGKIDATTNNFEIQRHDGASYLAITPAGNVGIGTTDPGAYKLAVKGKIRAEEVVVDTGWADFVFQKDYDLMPLEKVAKHIEKAGHLPGIPTAREVEENGISIGQIQSKLLQKIEEMTLYMIDLKKENETLKERISSLESRSR